MIKADKNTIFIKINLRLRRQSSSFAVLPLLLAGCGSSPQSDDGSNRRELIVKFGEANSTNEIFYFDDGDTGSIADLNTEAGVSAQNFFVRGIEITGLDASLSVGGLPNMVSNAVHEIGTASTVELADDVSLTLDFVATTDASTARIIQVMDQFRGSLTVNDSESVEINLDTAALELSQVVGDVLKNLIVKGSASESVQIVDLQDFGGASGFTNFDARGVTGAGVDVEFERPAAGISITMSDGDDTVTIYGNFDASTYADAAVKARASGDGSVMHAVSGTLNFGEGSDTLITYGAVDLTGVTSVEGIEFFIANSNVKLPAALFNQITGITFQGTTPHTLEIVAGSQAELDAVKTKLANDANALKLEGGATLSSVNVSPAPGVTEL